MIIIAFFLSILIFFGVIVYSAKNTVCEVIANGIDPVEMALIRCKIRQQEAIKAVYDPVAKKKANPWLGMTYTERLKEIAKMKRVIKGQNREIRKRMMANVIKRIK
jgi:hypothetical protein